MCLRWNTEVWIKDSPAWASYTDNGLPGINYAKGRK
jgi:hypothetical protein